MRLCLSHLANTSHTDNQWVTFVAHWLFVCVLNAVIHSGLSLCIEKYCF